MAEAHQTIVAGARQAGTRRLVTMLAYGSGSTADSAPTGVRLLGATVLRADYTDLAAAKQTVARSDLAWTVCFFGALTNDPPRPVLEQQHLPPAAPSQQCRRWLRCFRDLSLAA